MSGAAAAAAGGDCCAGRATSGSFLWHSFRRAAIASAEAGGGGAAASGCSAAAAPEAAGGAVAASGPWAGADSGAGAAPACRKATFEDALTLQRLDMEAAKVIDASGKHVMPGWTDIHTHYDTQCMWDPQLLPSGPGGVTSASAHKPHTPALW